MEQRTKIFVAGSRRLSRLSTHVLRRIDDMLINGCTLLVSDANGVDKAVQRYLHTHQYRDVVIYCLQARWRLNLGNWPVKSIEPLDSPQNGFVYLCAKDLAMARDCDYGLMVWDGRSPETLANILDLIKQAKPVLVYIAKAKRFFALWSFDDLSEMLGAVASPVQRSVETEFCDVVLA
ncbi:MAG TPA: hypothetical protein VEJ47_18755 [Candidatus Eremiobacteraceae bacterium]|nr:hypothetical protein [Candidatus Eremiobacteraceae bacterium]